MSTHRLVTVQSVTPRVAGEYLTFRLGDEPYGVTLRKMREIVQLQALTLVPQMPENIKGASISGVRSLFNIDWLVSAKTIERANQPS